MSENKAEIIAALGAAYSKTREDIARMEYLEDVANAGEIVIVYGHDGQVLTEVNVHCDSGCMAIYDVAKAVRKMLMA